MGMILPIVTLLPLVGALLCLALPQEEPELHRSTGFGASLLTFFASFLLLPGLDPAKMNHEVKWTWVESLGIHFHLGVDGISIWLVMLTTFLLPIVFLSTRTAITNKVREFVIATLVLETGMLGAFLALDLFAFYVFWEVMLIPMYFIIGIWGGEKRLKAAIKFVIFTMVGSLLMLVAILYVVVKVQQVTGEWSFSLESAQKLVLTKKEQVYLFLAFALAFCIKVPLFPLHTWLPLAHVEAPTAGSVILASVLLKFGPYGLIRFAIPVFPHAVEVVAPWLALLVGGAHGFCRVGFGDDEQPVRQRSDLPMFGARNFNGRFVLVRRRDLRTETHAENGRIWGSVETDATVWSDLSALHAGLGRFARSVWFCWRVLGASRHV